MSAQYLAYINDQEYGPVVISLGSIFSVLILGVLLDIADTLLAKLD